MLGKTAIGVYHLLNKPIQIHTESLDDDTVWSSIKYFCNKNYQFIWFITIPEDSYKLQKKMHNLILGYKLTLTKKEYYKKWTERIKWLKQNNQKFGLHIHLSCTRKELVKVDQERKIKNAINFSKKLGISFDGKFAAGWWIFNKTTLDLLIKYNFSKVYYFTENPTDFLRKKYYKTIELIPVRVYFHDYNLPKYR